MGREEGPRAVFPRWQKLATVHTVKHPLRLNIRSIGESNSWGIKVEQTPARATVDMCDSNSVRILCCSMRMGMSVLVTAIYLSGGFPAIHYQD